MDPRRVGRFVVEHEAGRGGMGIVYRATDSETGAPVALKVLRHADAREEDLQRFEREALALAVLEHPGIVRYFGHGRTEDGELYLAMAWLEGFDLQKRLEQGPLSIADTIALGRTVALALESVHARGLVHRDLKPSNIWLSQGDVRQPVLIDFGIARNAANATMTRTGMLIGTPQYMAPEQVRGGQIEPRTDLFSFGAILFECLSGHPPFLGEQVMAVLAKILLEDTPPLTSPEGPVPSLLVELTRKLLAKSPADRPASAREVGLALERCAEGSGEGEVLLLTKLASVLTGRERRLVTVVLAEDRRALPPPAEIIASAPLDRTATSGSQLPPQLLDVVRTHGGELSPLGTSRYLVSFPGAGGDAADQAASAARCALALAGAWKDAVVSLSLGRSPVGQVSVGEVIDRAASLLDAPGDARVRTDPSTAALLDVRFQVEPCGAFSSIVTERETEERPRTLLGRPTRFVGRSRELQSLEATLEEVVQDRAARAVLVTAPSGTGKSRLRFEFASRLKDRGIEVLIARAEPLRAGSPLDLCGSLVRAWAGLQGADEDTSRTKLTEHVAQRCGVGAGDLAEFLGELSGAPFPAAPGSRLAMARQDARLLGDHLLRSFVAILRAETAKNPTVLILEDLHWGDPQTVRFLETALKDLAQAPLMVLAFARPEVHERFPSLWRSRGVSEISLLPLSPRVCSELAREVLGDVDPSLVERLVRHSDGNAFYLEELIRAAAAGQIAQLPLSVVAMVQARLETLPAEERRVLRAASVLGESFDPRAVGALLGGHAADLDAVLSRLLDAEVMARRADDGAIAFRHAVVREAAYAMLTDADRRVGHGLAARWLEENGERDAHLLAEHHDRAGDAANAARCFARAARQAAMRNDHAAALERGQRALDLDPSPQVTVQSRLARGIALQGLGRLAEASAELELAVQALPAEGDDDSRLEVMRALLNHGVFRQSSQVIRRVAETTMQIARARQREDLVSEAECALAIADHCDERCDEALRRFRGVLAAPVGQRTSASSHAVIMLYHGAAFAEGERTARSFLAAARELQDSVAVAIQLGNLGVLTASQGRYAEADEHFREARADATRAGLLMFVARSVSLSAGHLIDLLDLDGAEQRALEAKDIGSRMEFPTPRVSATIDLAFIACRRGRAAEARQIVESVGKEIANGTGFHGWLWRSRAQVIRAELAVLDGRPEEALQLAEQAIETNLRLRRFKYVAVAEIALARALWRLDRRDDATKRLRDQVAAHLSFPDPSVRLRLATALHSLDGDLQAKEQALAAAGVMEEGLAPEARPAFRRAVEGSLGR